MSTTSNSTNEYLLLFRGSHWHRELSAEQIQAIMARMREWYSELSAKGILRGGQPLVEEGRIVSGKNGRTVADGPFAESKEAIGGYFAITATSLDEAAEIARDFPGLEFGSVVEVRPVAESCPLAAIAKEKEAARELQEPALA